MTRRSARPALRLLLASALCAVAPAARPLPPGESLMPAHIHWYDHMVPAGKKSIRQQEEEQQNAHPQVNTTPAGPETGTVAATGAPSSNQTTEAPSAPVSLNQTPEAPLNQTGEQGGLWQVAQQVQAEQVMQGQQQQEEPDGEVPVQQQAAKREELANASHVQQSASVLVAPSGMQIASVPEGKPQLISPSEVSVHIVRFLEAATSSFNPIHSGITAIAMSLVIWVVLTAILTKREAKRKSAEAGTSKAA